MYKFIVLVIYIIINMLYIIDIYIYMDIMERERGERERFNTFNLKKAVDFI